MVDMMNRSTALLSAPSSHSMMIDDDSSLDGCSICLEPFASLDPPCVTKCKHEYHLHCILEWSQRRIECPVCLQHLVLKDPASQELLSAVASEENLSSRQTLSPTVQSNENSHHVREPENEQPIMRHFAAIASRARNLSMRRQMIPTAGSSQILPSVSEANTSNQTQSNGSSEFVAFSESLKSKISTASIRYKESISKSTHSLKEKLIARNDSVKELSRGVQREMSAGIAGIARMIAQKRGGISSPSSSCTMESSRHGVMFVVDEVQSFSPNRGETSKQMSSDSTP